MKRNLLKAKALMVFADGLLNKVVDRARLSHHSFDILPFNEQSRLVEEEMKQVVWKLFKKLGPNL